MNLRDKLRGLLVRLYARRVEGHLDHAQVPKHIGVIMDGNRRWAKASGSTTVHGHRAGADKIEEFLGWCTETDVEVVTLWLLSTDNFDRPQEELVPLLGIIEDVVRTLAADGRWRVHHVGAMDLLPAGMQATLKEAEEATAHIKGIVVNVAIGYGGRQEIADAVRSMLFDAHDKGVAMEDLAESVDIDMIGRHLYTSDQPDPDLVIRTSGEQRLSGFMLWQTAHSEYHFCDVYWPASARSTSCARCATTPHVTAGTAAEPRTWAPPVTRPAGPMCTRLRADVTRSSPSCRWPLLHGGACSRA